MAIQATAQWYVRTDSPSDARGAGYDPGIAGAGTNYADQSDAQVFFTGGNGNLLSTSGAGSTTLISAGTPFTSDMVGNAIYIPSGQTNFTAGYYFITGYISSSQVTLDRSPSPSGAGSSGSGWLGGAARFLGAFMTGSAGSSQSGGPPTVAGNTVWVRGAGSDNPSSPDHTFTGYFDTFVPGGSAGVVKVKGYNGRPFLRGNGLLFFGPLNWHFEHLKFSQTGGANANNLIDNGQRVSVHDCYWDQNGIDFGFGKLWAITGSLLDNTGSTTAGVLPAVTLAGLNNSSVAIGNRFRNLRYRAVSASAGALIDRNIFQSMSSHGIIIPSGATPVATVIRNNAFYGCAGAGLRIDESMILQYLLCQNNIFVANGAYGIDVSVGSASANDPIFGVVADYNAFYNNTSGSRHNISAGPHDVALTGDPFTNSGSGDFSLNSTAGAGGACRGVGWPTSWPG